MLVQYTAASLVSESKSLAHPASVDSIPSSAGQEDHVSMGMTAARHAREIVANAETVVALEALGAAQALDLRAPLEPAPATRAAVAVLRAAAVLRGGPGIRSRHRGGRVPGAFGRGSPPPPRPSPARSASSPDLLAGDQGGDDGVVARPVRDVRERRSVQQHEVGTLAGLQRAEPIVEAEHPCRVRGRSRERIEGVIP